MRTTYDTDSTSWPEIWQAAYKILEDRIVPTQLKAWIQPIELLGSEDRGDHELFMLQVPNDFSAQWLNDHHRDTITQALNQVTGKACQIEFKIKSSSRSSAQEDSDSPQAFHPENLIETDPSPDLSEQISDSNLFPSEITITSPTQARSLTGDPRSDTVAQVDPRFAFDNFVVGASNQFAYASGIAVADNPGKTYNPLFLYSPPGLGKTHLLHAVGNYMLAQNPKARVAYLSAESFVNELIESLQHQRMSKFREKYRRSYDVLLIDDIQFIAGKKQTEEEFFHTFNALYGAKRQIVLSSDRPPKEIQNLEERIRTRFEWGLVADIQPPEIETRIAILKSKAEKDDIYLPDDVATFLASHFKSNVRELEGTLIRLQAQASLSGAEITLDMARQELRHIIQEEETKVTPEGIQGLVAQHFGLKVNDLRSTTRAKSIAVPRQVAMYLVRKYTGLGWKLIGEHFGKDHTTVIHAFEKIEESVKRNDPLRDDVEAIQNML